MAKYLFEDEQGIKNMLKLMEHPKQVDDFPDIHDVAKKIEETREIVMKFGEGRIPWQKWFIDLGSTMLSILDFRDIDLASFTQLLLQKHKLYGAEPLTRWGKLGILIRIDSKVARAENLYERTGIESIESYDDTMKDILGYCILGAALTLVPTKGVQ